MAAKARDGEDAISIHHATTIQRAGDEEAARKFGLDMAIEAWPVEDGWTHHDASVVNLHVARTTHYRDLQVASCQETKPYCPHAHADGERRFRGGERQLRCPACERWKWPDKLCKLGKRELGLVDPEEDPAGYTRQQVRQMLAGEVENNG